MRATRSRGLCRSGGSSADGRSSGSLRKNLGLGRLSGYPSKEAPWHASWSPRSCFGRPIPGRSPHWPEAPWVRSPASTGDHPASAPIGAARTISSSTAPRRHVTRATACRHSTASALSRAPGGDRRSAAVLHCRSSGGLPSGNATGRGGRELLHAHALPSVCGPYPQPNLQRPGPPSRPRRIRRSLCTGYPWSTTRSSLPLTCKNIESTTVRQCILSTCLDGDSSEPHPRTALTLL